MRGLSGDFSTMPLKDLVAYLGNRRATGVLRVVRGEVRKLIQLRDGEVVSASSNQPREHIGQFLINQGHVSPEQLARAYATQRETRFLMGKILVMTGQVPEQTVRDTLALKFRETLLDAFPWKDGEFSFDAGEPPVEIDGLDVRVELADVHHEGEFREAAWEAIRAVFPSGGVYLEVDEQRLPEPPRPDSLDGRLVSLIAQGLSIEELAVALRISDFPLYQRLYAFHRREAVKVREGPPPGRRPAPEGAGDETPGGEASVIGAESPASEVVQAARSLLEDGNFRDGEALARRAHEMAPSSETEELLRSAEAALLGALRRELLEKARVPSLRVSPARLKTMQLGAPERYLLSRIDGKRDLGAIIHMSPLQELDALKHFRRFLESGLVEFPPR
jgi:hypothetical protein